MVRTFADVESVLVGWLTTNAPGVICGVDVPINLGDPGVNLLGVVQLRRIGGPKRQPHMEAATVDVNCFHTTRAATSDLADQISTLLFRALPGSWMNVDGVRASIGEVSEIAGAAERDYDNPRVVRFGFVIQTIIKSSIIPA